MCSKYILSKRQEELARIYTAKVFGEYAQNVIWHLLNVYIGLFLQYQHQ